MSERILRVAETFREVARLDRQGKPRPNREGRVFGVEQLRRTLFDEDPTQSQLDRILVANEHAHGCDEKVAMPESHSPPGAQKRPARTPRT